MQEYFERLIIDRNKTFDNAVLGEIQKIAKRNGVDTTVYLNEKAIVEALKQYQRNVSLIDEIRAMVIHGIYYTVLKNHYDTRFFVDCREEINSLFDNYKNNKMGGKQ